MADYTQSGVVDLLAHQHVTHPASVVGTARAANGILAAHLTILHGFIEAVANTNPAVITIEVTPDATNDDNWAPARTLTVTTTTPVSEQPSGAEAAGQKVIEVVSTVGFVAGARVYFQDATLAESEWHRVEQVVAATSIDLLDGIVNAKVATDTIFTEAEVWPIDLDLRGIRRYRATYQSEGAAAANSAIWIRTLEVSAFE